MIDPLPARIRVESEAVEVVTRGRPDRSPAVLPTVHDRSTLHFAHESKADRATLTHASGVGYDPDRTLIVRIRDGEPIGPAEADLQPSDVVHTTREAAAPPPAYQVGQLLDAMDHVRGVGLGPATLVHVINRETD
ncbi:hypothetical protein [Planctomyces sp. SH-PL62]|uniref:hypothetical protein n=1 Tax=Planctomyces sp. SH-PL62 TaxID=1636152 RepID=UPI0012E79B79|nr:hypothetical protein [Planctomyces sp. SH-PL62]